MKTRARTKQPAVLTPPPVSLASTNLASIFGARGPVSTLHFLVHAAMPELQREAEARGWNARGWTTLSIAWQELRWTDDGWKTMHVISSNDVPCPVVNGNFHLGECKPGSTVEFAIHVGLACHAPHDTAGARDVAEVWLNNGGRNFTQTTR